jgi:hypothetical protein
MLRIYTESVVFATKPALDCLTGARKIYDALRDSFPPGREAEPCIRDLLSEVGGILTTRTSAVNGLGQLVPKLDYAGQSSAYTTDKARQFRDRLTQCLGLPFDDYEQIKLSAAFTLACPSPVPGWDGRPHQNAHLAAVNMVETALSLLTAGSRLDPPHLLHRFGGTERRTYREAILAHRTAIRRRVRALPGPGPVAAALEDAIRAEYRRVSEVLAAWEAGQEQLWRPASTPSEGSFAGSEQPDPASSSPERPEPPDRVEAGDHPYRFEREGKVWHIQYGKEAGTLTHLLGFVHIAHLLARPSKPIPALKLHQAESLPCVPLTDQDEDVQGAKELGDLYTVTQTSQPILDAEAWKAYRRRVKELKGQIAEAHAAGNDPEVERLESEKQVLLNELKQAHQFGQKQRSLGPTYPAEKARQAVFHALRRAYEGLRERGLGQLADHLLASIETQGTSYCYSPHPQPPDWQL